MTPKTPAQHQAEYYRRKLAAGFKQIVLWVRADKVQALKDFAAKSNEPVRVLVKNQIDEKFNDKVLLMKKEDANP